MSGSAKFCLLALVFFLNSCATAEYRMVRGECARDAYQQIPYKEEINIQTLYKTVQVPTGQMHCSGTTRKMGYFGGDPVCSMEMRSEQQSYQNVRKIDANKGRRDQVINSCTESQCFARYGNARCEPKKVVQNISFSNEEAIAINNRGLALFNQGVANRWDDNSLLQAVNHFKESIEIYPNAFMPHYNLANAYFKLGHYEEAITSIKEGIRLNSDSIVAHYILGHSYGKLGQHQKAIASYKEAIRIKPDYENAHHQLGFSYAKLGQYQEAIASFKEVIRINPNNTDSHGSLGWAYENMDRNDEAIAKYKEVLRIDPNNTFARNSLNKLEEKIKLNLAPEDKI